MPVQVVLDHPRRHVGRRLLRRASAMFGVVLVVVGVAASFVAIPANFFLAGWLLDASELQGIEIPQGRPLVIDELLAVWAIATPLAIFGTSRGMRLVRSGRTLVLFLRRFGYDDATRAVTFAVTRTIGGSWRLVTLDDAEIAPVGVPAGTRWVFGAASIAGRLASRAVEIVVRVFPVVQVAVLILVGIDLVSARIWERAADPEAWIEVLQPYVDILAIVFDGRLPLDAVAPTFPGVFAALATVIGGIVLAVVAVVAPVLTAVPPGWLIGGLLLVALLYLSSGPVGHAERVKTREIRTERDLADAAHAIGEASRRVFGPRLVVLRVASALWRDTVSRFARVSSVALVDVSEPTEHLVWEIESLTAHKRHCIFIGRHDRALRLAARDAASSVHEHRVADLLEWEEVLAYTTDRRGMRRFARALRNTLLSAHDGAAAPPASVS